jgi:hypothetical protein
MTGAPRAITFAVLGHPQPAGSKRAFANKDDRADRGCGRSEGLPCVEAGGRR